MGSKNRYLILIILSFHAVMNAQEASDYKYIDSLTYACYNSRDWNKLIEVGQDAIAEGIDYKYLRQRLGYAYFSKGDYFEARSQFEKALSFDNYNSFSLEYLYYSNLYTGKEEYTGVFSGRLNPELRKKLSVSPFKPLESIELEYNFKFAVTAHRSNPQYYRFGINTKLGYRLSLYQSFSNYKQEIMIQQIGTNKNTSVKQPEYYALLKWNASSHLMLKTAYHFINTTSESSLTNGNLLLFAIAPDFNRFSLETYGSILSVGKDLIYQAGVQTGYVFPGRINFSLTGTVSRLFQQNNSRFIYTQKAGLKVLKQAWIEGNVTFGRMTGYNDYNGLYVYNTFDPMTFRTGATMIYYLGKNIALWANYSYERKENFENSSFHYNQFSYLGGIKWKL